MKTIFVPGDRCAWFEIVRLIGIGGFAEVYEARLLPVPSLPPSTPYRALSGTCALKVLRALDDPKLAEQVRDRFAQEIEVVAMIEHVNVVRFIDVGVHGPHLWFAQELVRGRNFRQILDESGGKLSVERAVTILRHACEGIDAAHQLGIIHRDLKPENILVTFDDVAKVADWGAAKILKWGVQTAMNHRVGTASYSLLPLKQADGLLFRLPDGHPERARPQASRRWPSCACTARVPS
jgi:serine/threonine-protein kinase